MEQNSDKQDEPNINDLQILEDLIKTIYDAINNKTFQPKVGDLLKVIELKRKLSVEGKGEKKFWAMVNKIRQEELKKSKNIKSGKNRENISK